MLDQLADIAGSLPISDGSRVSTFFLTYYGDLPMGPQDLSTSEDGIADLALNAESTERQMRRPLLGSLRQIESIRDLVPFFSNVSIASYESVYASAGNIDWEAVERGLMDDMFEGR